MIEAVAAHSPKGQAFSCTGGGGVSTTLNIDFNNKLRQLISLTFAFCSRAIVSDNTLKKIILNCIKHLVDNSSLDIHMYFKFMYDSRFQFIKSKSKRTLHLGYQQEHSCKTVLNFNKIVYSYPGRDANRSYLSSASCP